MSTRTSLFVVMVIALVLPAAATAQTMLQVDKVFADDSEVAERFARVVAISGDIAVVGASYDDDLGEGSGSVYVFVRDGNSWVQQDKLLASDGAAFDNFGAKIAISDDTIVVSATGVDELGDNAGAAYVFIRNGSTWSQQMKLLADDGEAGDTFGTAVAIQGNTIVVGAGLNDETTPDVGAAYVFVRNGTNWTQQAKLLADVSIEDDFLGMSAAISGDTALIGADYGCCLPGLSNDTGAVFVFVRDGTTWTQQAKLVADDADGGDRFGFSLAVSGDTALIGSPQDRISGQFSGSVYVFERSGTTWAQIDKLLPDANGNLFGVSLSMSGELAVIGDNRDENTEGFGGAAYVFHRTTQDWVRQQKLFADDGESGNDFGYSASISDGTVVIGASDSSDQVSFWGAGYVFSLDSDDDGVVDYLDAFPTDPDETVDTDGDGTGNNADLDDDNDDVPDIDDAFPLDAAESLDTDSDGTGNNADTDDDGDGIPDDYETENGLNPLDASDADTDADGDGFTTLQEFEAGTDPQDAAEFAVENEVPISIFILLEDEEA